MHHDVSNRWGSFSKKVQVLSIDRQSIMVFESFAGGCLSNANFCTNNVGNIVLKE